MVSGGVSRHATYCYFVSKSALFMVLDTEYSRPALPPGMKEKVELYNRLQTEDPAAAQAMLGEAVGHLQADPGGAEGHIRPKGPGSRSVRCL